MLLIGSDEKMDASKVLNPTLIAAEQVQIVTNRFSSVEESLRILEVLNNNSGIPTGEATPAGYSRHCY